MEGKIRSGGGGGGGEVYILYIYVEPLLEWSGRLVVEVGVVVEGRWGRI